MKTKEKSKERQEKDTWRTQKDLEIVKAFVYDGIYGDDFLAIHIYDKKSKRVFAGNIKLSSYSRADMLKLDNITSNYIKQQNKKKLKELKEGGGK